MVLNTEPFSPGLIERNKSAKGNDDIYNKRRQMFITLLDPLTEKTYCVF